LARYIDVLADDERYAFTRHLSDTEMIMRTLTTISLALAATAAVAVGAYAAEQAAQAPMQSSHEQKVADTDFGKVSVQGAKAYRDVQLTRLAIFNARPASAKTLIADAKTAIGNAQKDDTIFMKAESKLRAPGKSMQSSNPDTKQVAWLPVDGQMILGENYVSSPQKAAAIADANTSLKQGDRKGAAERLKLAGINVDFTMAVVPLAKTTSDIDQAATLIDDGKYYEANTSLLQAENGVRFDIADADVPMKSSASKK
jgi:hypothetical protein